MDNCHELACLIEIANHTMAFIIWRIIENRQTKYSIQEAHLGVDELSLRVAILRTRHLVEKLSKQPHVGKLIQYHQCLPHFVEMEQTGKYLQRQQITYTNEGVKSFDNEIDDFFIPAQLILYAQVGCLRNQEPIIRFFCNVKLECMCSFVGTLQH